jgi:hypothetical protein
VLKALDSGSTFNNPDPNLRTEESFLHYTNTANKIKNCSSRVEINNYLDSRESKKNQ